MALHCVADLLEAFAKAGQLARVAVPVDPELELAEIVARVAKSAGPALLFERVTGHDSAVLANLFGTEQRLCMALGVESLDAFAERIAGLAEHAGQTSWLDRLSGRGAETPLARFSPKTVKVGASQQVVKLGRDVDLAELPAPRCWPDETHRSITAGQLIVVDPESAARVGERCPLVIIGRDRLAALVSPYGAAARLFAAASASGEKVSGAITLGGSPIEMLLGELPLSDSIDRFALAGLLGESPLTVVAARSQQLEVSAEAELVIEAELDLQEPELPAATVAGPIGFYTSSQSATALRVTAITHRANAAFPALIGGSPANDLSAIDHLVAKLLLPLAQSVAPEVTDLALPTFGMRSFVIVAIDKCYPRQAAKVAHALLGHAALMTARTLVVVDRDVNVHDTSDVMFRVAANVRGLNDNGSGDVTSPGGPASRFDHAPGKILLDATAKLPGEADFPWPAEARSDENTRDLVARRWAEYGLG